MGHQLLDLSKVRFNVIDGRAIEAFYLWGGDAQFPWEDVPAWKALDAKGFDLSIWHDQQLCGLCYATPRDSKVTIKIVLLEGSSNSEHPLKGLIAALALGAIDSYARVIGCSRIEIQEPRPDVVPTYERLGFIYDEKRRHVISVEHIWYEAHVQGLQRLGLMKTTPRKANAQLVEMFCAEAKKLGGSTSVNQKRFFSVAIEHGRGMEPEGPLAGPSR